MQFAQSLDLTIDAFTDGCVKQQRTHLRAEGSDLGTTSRDARGAALQRLPGIQDTFVITETSDDAFVR